MENIKSKIGKTVECKTNNFIFLQTLVSIGIIRVTRSSGIFNITRNSISAINRKLSEDGKH